MPNALVSDSIVPLINGPVVYWTGRAGLTTQLLQRCLRPAPVKRGEPNAPNNKTNRTHGGCQLSPVLLVAPSQNLVAIATSVRHILGEDIHCLDECRAAVTVVQKSGLAQSRSPGDLPVARHALGPTCWAGCQGLFLR